MTLQEYILHESAILIKFEKWWTENNKKTPSLFPMDIGASDWFEQYIIFSGSVDLQMGL